MSIFQPSRPSANLALTFDARGAIAKALLVCTVFVAVAAASAPVRSQSISQLEDRSRYSSASFYSYVEPGQTPMRVNVWGAVPNPGLYAVPRGTPLSMLLSLAGGPEVTPRTQQERRKVILQLAREMEGGRQVIYSATMQDEVLASEEDPLLREGDTVTVDIVQRRRFSWRDALPIISTAASVAAAIAFFVRD